MQQKKNLSRYNRGCTPSLMDRRPLESNEDYNFIDKIY